MEKSRMISELTDTVNENDWFATLQNLIRVKKDFNIIRGYIHYGKQYIKYFNNELLDLVVDHRGRHDILILLIEAGLDINLDNGTTIRKASASGFKNVVKVLLKYGLNLDLVSQGVSAASNVGESEILNLLLDYGGWNNNALANAAFDGNQTTIKILVKNGYDATENRNKIVRDTLIKGDEITAEVLIDYGADPGDDNYSVVKNTIIKGYAVCTRLALDNISEWSHDTIPQADLIGLAVHSIDSRKTRKTIDMYKNY